MVAYSSYVHILRMLLRGAGLNALFSLYLFPSLSVLGRALFGSVWVRWLFLGLISGGHECRLLGLAQLGFYLWWLGLGVRILQVSSSVLNYMVKRSVSQNKSTFTQGSTSVYFFPKWIASSSYTTSWKIHFCLIDLKYHIYSTLNSYIYPDLLLNSWFL